MRDQGQKLSVATHTADAIEDASDLEGLMEDSEHLDQIQVTEVKFKAWIKKVYSTSRGRELPGNYNHVLLAELFHFQSRRWKDMASKHLGAVHSQLESFIQTLAQHVTQDERISMEIADKVAQHLSGQMSRASAELEVLIEDERQQPITYNHYYTDNVQRARQGDSQDLISTVIQDAADNDYGGALHISNNGIDMQRLIKALQRRVIIDMDEQACAEARAGLDAYYKASQLSLPGMMSAC